MFDQITVIVGALTGKLREAPTLRKYFWPFLAASLFAIVILTYVAYMSRHYYLNLLERFAPGEASLWIATFVTISVAVVAYFMISSFTGTILDYIHRRTYKTSGNEPMFIAVALGLCLILWLDIHANLKGVDYVSHSTTTAAMANPLPSITSKHDGRLEKAAVRFDKEIAEAQAGIAAIKKYAGKASHKCNSVGCEKGFAKTKECSSGCHGAAHWAGAITPYGQAVINKYQAQIDQTRAEKAAALASIRADKEADVTMASTDFLTDRNRYESTVSDKRTGHTNLVWFAYGLAALICIFTNSYCDQALEYINGPSTQSTAYVSSPPAAGFTTSAKSGPVPSTAEANRIRELEERLRRLETGSGRQQSTVKNSLPTVGFRTLANIQEMPPTVESERIRELEERLKQLEDSSGRQQSTLKNAEFIERVPHIICAYCDTEAPKTTWNRKYCSEECKFTHYNELNPDNPVRFNADSKGGNHEKA